MKNTVFLACAWIGLCLAASATTPNQFEVVSGSIELRGEGSPQNFRIVDVPGDLVRVGDFWMVSLSKGKEYQLLRTDLISSVRIREYETRGDEPIAVVTIGFMEAIEGSASRYLVRKKLNYGFPTMDEALGFAKQLAGGE
ncbi:MAG: hypothetical protein JJU20_07755 [Opitutales bacterium]|nr:hypothetical protein [Opitutales bacterium]